MNKDYIIPHISRHRQTYIWVLIFCLFFASVVIRTEFIAALAFTSFAVVPMFLLSLLVKKVLIPKFLNRHRFFYYINGAVTVLAFTIIVPSLARPYYGYAYKNGLLAVSDNVRNNVESTHTKSIGTLYLFTLYGTLFLSTFAVTTISSLLDERKRIEQEAKEEKMRQELKYLRAQIKPHFLFNALNCIYSLSLAQDEKAPDCVLKLSEMLRFVIDDCRADNVPIMKEVAYINNYINFQKITMEHEPNITFDCYIEDEMYQIPPMLFQPMIENCFKHSQIIHDTSAWIRISLKEKNNHIFFETENTKHINRNYHQDDERTGIGVNNVKHRLDLIFGSDYSFIIEDKKETYKTKLYI
ncbi:MAG: histidine kinase [Bacteroidales bacterium]|nr:histidine kinase [Bacteroidales bacterium]